MRVLLVVGGWTPADPVPEVRSAHLAGRLEAEGHRVTVTALAYGDGLEGHVEDAELVVITCGAGPRERALELAARARRAGKLVVMCGPSTAAEAEWVLSGGWAEFVAPTDDDETIVELCRGLGKDGPAVDPSGVRGLWWRHAESGVPIRNQPRTAPPRLGPTHHEAVPVSGSSSPAVEALLVEAYWASRDRTGWLGCPSGSKETLALDEFLRSVS